MEELTEYEIVTTDWSVVHITADTFSVDADWVKFYHRDGVLGAAYASRGVYCVRPKQEEKDQ